MLESITIKLAENGFTVECYERPDKKEKADDKCCSPSMWEPPKNHVFESVDTLLAYVGGKLNSGKPKYNSLTDRVKAKAKNKEAKTDAASK